MSDLDLVTSAVSLVNHPDIQLVEMTWNAPRSHDGWQTVDEINDTELTEVTTVGHFLGLNDEGNLYRIAGSLDAANSIGRDVMYIPVSLVVRVRVLVRWSELVLPIDVPIDVPVDRGIIG